jgi:uncharacterized cupin superfamily protein
MPAALDGLMDAQAQRSTAALGSPPARTRRPSRGGPARWAAVCKDSPVRRANVLSVDCDYDETDPDGYHSAVADVGRAVGAEAMVVKVYELPEGESVCPYHYEYEEEWLAVLDGSLTLRSPDGEATLRRGALVCFPPGRAGAHQVSNRGERTAIVMMWSSSREPAVAVYPDSDKIGVWPGGEGDELILRRSDGAVDYWDGEA